MNNTNTNAETGTAKDSNNIENMRDGILCGYLLALQHVEDMIERRIVGKSELINKFRKTECFDIESRFASMREEAGNIMMAIDAHVEQTKKTKFINAIMESSK